ncbi:HNH endonuclease [Enterovibrio sp. FF113]|uniref:HNH endonuclease n=1 Tax=Enterovibrio sp. FF113 TaxID=3230010 RepID=UPI00352F33DA
MSSSWSHEELEAAVLSYLDIQTQEKAGKKVIKKHIYQSLSDRYGRTAKAYEYRFQNISHVLNLMGRSWINGLKPAKNVGEKTEKQIEGLILKHEVARQQINESGWDQLSGGYVVKSKPLGEREPKAGQSQVTIYSRSDAVRDWVLRQANGDCECCGKRAPFIKDSGEPYLEIHHVRRLADGGSDCIENAVAVCPNCHRALHFSEGRRELVELLYLTVPRLARK